MATLAGEIPGQIPSIVAAPQQQQQQQHNDVKNLPISVSVLVRSTNYIQNIKSVPEKTMINLLGKKVDFVIESSSKANCLGRSFVAISIVKLESLPFIIFSNPSHLNA